MTEFGNLQEYQKPVKYFAKMIYNQKTKVGNCYLSQKQKLWYCSNSNQDGFRSMGIALLEFPYHKKPTRLKLIIWKLQFHRHNNELKW